jgi:6-pyruvoyltetrahydropterin/6-carboxytetrahydropterin synthase
MFELSVETHFSAAHHLEGYDGKCSAPHGHNWEVEVSVRGEHLSDAGMLIDFHELKEAVRADVEQLDHTDLNTLACFAETDPTSERLAKYLYDGLSAKLAKKGFEVCRVTVCETPGSSASYFRT